MCILASAKWEHPRKVLAAVKKAALLFAVRRRKLLIISDDQQFNRAEEMRGSNADSSAGTLNADQ